MSQKDYYRYEELINGLRPAFLESQKILKDLDNTVKVESKDPCKHSFRINLGSKIRDDKPQVILLVEKSDALIGTKIRKITNNISSNPFKRQKDFAFFNILEDGDKYKLEQNKNYYYHPVPTIINKEEFAKKYKELKETDLYGLTEFCEKLNPFQYLYIWGNRLILSSEGEYGKGIDLSYNAEDDKIHIKSSKRYSTYFIGELLETPIPKYLLPEEYREKIDKSIEDFNGVYVDDFVGRRKESLKIEDKPKQLILKR